MNLMSGTDGLFLGRPGVGGSSRVDDERLAALRRELLAYSTSRGLKRQHAEDLVHETVSLLIVYEGRVTSPRPWAYKVLRRLMGRFWADQQRTLPLGEDHDQPLQENASRKLLHQEIRELVSQLPRRQRQALELWLQDVAISDIAELMNVKYFTVRNLVQQAKASLRSRLELDEEAP